MSAERVFEVTVSRTTESLVTYRVSLPARVRTPVSDDEWWDHMSYTADEPNAGGGSWTQIDEEVLVQDWDGDIKHVTDVTPRIAACESAE